MNKYTIPYQIQFVCICLLTIYKSIVLFLMQLSGPWFCYGFLKDSISIKLIHNFKNINYKVKLYVIFVADVFLTSTRGTCVLHGLMVILLSTKCPEG